MLSLCFAKYLCIGLTVKPTGLRVTVGQLGVVVRVEEGRRQISGGHGCACN